MNKLLLFLIGILLLIFIVSCASHKKNNRYKTYEIFPSLSLNDPDSTKIDELKFKPFFNSMDSQKLIFQKFGKWDNVKYINRKHPLLIWSDLKLFSWSDEVYIVGVSGEDSGLINYCSALVLNSKGENCLSKNSKTKDSIVKYFIQGTENIIRSDKKFKKEIKTLYQK